MASVCMLTKNSARTIVATLKSLADFEEVLILDTGSTDATLILAKGFPNVVIHETPFTGFGELRNRAADLAKNDWILALDSDEVLSPALAREIHSLSLNPECVYEIDFKNFYNGKQILGCGWHPESHIRLYHRLHTRFSDAALHEGILKKGSVVRLEHPISHTPYLTISDFLLKMQRYSDLFAEEYRGKRSSSFGKALWHGFGAFSKSYLLKRGIFLRAEGFIISSYNGMTAFYKYLKLAEANRNLS
jgi:glycosyltransferase involved in cell wall biosynthesis